MYSGFTSKVPMLRKVEIAPACNCNHKTYYGNYLNVALSKEWFGESRRSQ